LSFAFLLTPKERKVAACDIGCLSLRFIDRAIKFLSYFQNYSRTQCTVEGSLNDILWPFWAKKEKENNALAAKLRPIKLRIR
jgi:hypothetical protein